MSVADLAIVAALVFGWGALSARLERFDVTAPITFVLAGLLLTHWPLAFLSVTPSKELIKTLAEFTLALVLFSDASRVGLHELRADSGLYLRLLGAALPVTIGLGTLLAFALDRSAGIWLALLVGAALAPTDAALGAGMMANPVVPARIRRLINVESGLNDGIATPFVSVALAGAATAGEVAGHGPAAAVAELALGVVVGVAVGGAGGLLVSAARKRGWVAEGFAGPAGLGLAVCAYASSVAVHGNGFIAAFVGGLAFGTASGRRGEPLVPFVEETGALVSLLVWLAFGAVAVAPAVAWRSTRSSSERNRVIVVACSLGITGLKGDLAGLASGARTPLAPPTSGRQSRANAACASFSRSTQGSPATSTRTLWIVPPVNAQGDSPG